LCEAQFLDSIKAVVKRKYSIDARLESRNSFIDNSLTTVSGARLGLAFQQKLRFGFGADWLKSDITKTTQRVLPDRSVEKTTYFLKWAYISAYVDFVFYKTKRWQLGVPIQIGLGQSWWQLDRTYRFKTNEAKYFVFIYEPGITAQFKVFKFFGLGADVAYRFCLKDNSKVGPKLTAPTYSFKLLFWGDQLFYEVFPRSKITKRFGPAYW
jgi:hypothetical protein